WAPFLYTEIRLLRICSERTDTIEEKSHDCIFKMEGVALKRQWMKILVVVVVAGMVFGSFPLNHIAANDGVEGPFTTYDFNDLDIGTLSGQDGWLSGTDLGDGCCIHDVTTEHLPPGSDGSQAVRINHEGSGIREYVIRKFDDHFRLPSFDADGYGY